MAGKTKATRAKAKTATRKRTTGTKKATGEVNIRRAGARTVAMALWNRGPVFWREVVSCISALERTERPAQVMPTTH